jgi:hypothetical protein
MFGFSWTLNNLEDAVHEAGDQWGHYIPVLDVILWGRDISDLFEIQRKAHEELERRLGCQD